MVDSVTGSKGFGPLGSINRTGKCDATTKSGSTQKSDRVDFSSVLQNATKVQATGVTQETARAEKIQALKSQIENGTYKPDLDKVASSLLPFILKES